MVCYNYLHKSTVLNNNDCQVSQVYVDALQENDYLFIARALHPSIPEGLLEKMVRFNGRVYEDTMVAHAYGHSGSPWEFNLRDILRWCELVEGILLSSKLISGFAQLFVLFFSIKTACP